MPVVQRTCTFDDWRAFANPQVAPPSEPYGTLRSAILDEAGFTAAAHEIARVLADPLDGDPAIVAGETRAAGLAALLAAQQHAPLCALLELNPASRVLLLGSEGDTDPEIYRSITGRTADEVRP